MNKEIKKIVSITFFLLLIFFESNAQEKFSDRKYVSYIDTGYVCFTQPHFLCYFISSSKKTLEEALSKSKYFYFIGVYNKSIKDFFFENIDKDSINSNLIKSKAILYTGKSIVQKDLIFFRAIVNVKVPLGEMKFKDRNYSGESIRYENREIKLFKIINYLGLSYNFTYEVLREGD